MSSAPHQTASICAQVVFCGEVLNANRMQSTLVDLYEEQLNSAGFIVGHLLQRSRHTGAMDPVTALRQIAYYKDRSRKDPKRGMAYRKAADIIEAPAHAARDLHPPANSWQSLPGIRPKTPKVLAQAWPGREPGPLV